MKDKNVSRRDFLKLAAGAAAGTAAVAAGSGLRLGAAPAAPAAGVAAGPAAGGAAVPAALGTGRKTLRIAKWAHFLPEYDQWFETVLAREWGQRNDTNVVVDHIPVTAVAAGAAAEAAAGRGHDIFMLPWPPADLQTHTIDHAEIYQRVSFKHGNVDRLTHKSTFDPAAKRYFAFADFWVPSPLHYYEDNWSAVKMPLGPLHYGSLRSGGSRMRSQLGVPTGLAITSTLEGNVTLTSLLDAFGGGILDANRNVSVNRGSRSIAALRYVKMLFDETAAAEQLAWGPGDHVRAMLARKTSCTVNSIALLRMAEKENPELGAKIRLSPPLLANRGIFSVPHATNCSVVWKFADNPEGAKDFLADLIDSSRAGYDASRGCNMPLYQKTLPDLIVRLENDPKGEPPYKYKELKDALHWTANQGFPDFANPVATAAWTSYVVPRMFQNVVKGALRPEEAVKVAEEEIKRLAEPWRKA